MIWEADYKLLSSIKDDYRIGKLDSLEEQHYKQAIKAKTYAEACLEQTFPFNLCVVIEVQGINCLGIIEGFAPIFRIKDTVFPFTYKKLLPMRKVYLEPMFVKE